MLEKTALKLKSGRRSFQAVQWKSTTMKCACTANRRLLFPKDVLIRWEEWEEQAQTTLTAIYYCKMPEAIMMSCVVQNWSSETAWDAGWTNKPDRIHQVWLLRIVSSHNYRQRERHLPHYSRFIPPLLPLFLFLPLLKKRKYVRLGWLRIKKRNAFLVRANITYCCKP